MKIQITTALKVHGIRGKIKVDHFDEDIQEIVLIHGINDGETQYKVEKIEKLSNRHLIFKLHEVDSYETAQNFINKKFYIDKEYLPELKNDEYYTTDLIGTRTFLQNGDAYGTIINMYDFGAGDVAEIKLIDNQTIMVPFTKELFIENDMINKTAIIYVPESISAE